eukprot:scaffold101771_cov84-Phaeocystis_antarctica.AAC.2
MAPHGPTWPQPHMPQPHMPQPCDVGCRPVCRGRSCLTPMCRRRSASSRGIWCSPPWPPPTPPPRSTMCCVPPSTSSTDRLLDCAADLLTRGKLK